MNQTKTLFDYTTTILAFFFKCCSEINTKMINQIASELSVPRRPLHGRLCVSMARSAYPPIATSA